MRWFTIVMSAVALLLAGCISEKSSMKVSSPSFPDGGYIPQKYTCDGENIFPTLEFSDVPEEAKSLAIIMYDPDAPGGTFTHWIIWNIPANVTEIKEGTDLNYPQGENDFGNIGYGGPCPPKGTTHRYYFRVYALDTFLNLHAGASRSELIDAMSGHIIAKATLMGRYGR